MPRVSYPTDLRDTEWAILEPLLPPSKSLGRPRADLRAVLNAIRYVTRSGAQWRMVPRDLVPWGTAWSYFRCWRDDGTWRSCTTTCERMSVGPLVAIRNHPPQSWTASPSRQSSGVGSSAALMAAS